MKEKLKFKTFTEFCDRADEILQMFAVACIFPTFKISKYRDYVYYEHKFSNNYERDMTAKDRIWEWLMSYKYEKMDKNDLFSVKRQLKKGE